MDGRKTIGSALAAALVGGLLVVGAANPAVADTALVDYSCDIPPVNALIQSQVPDPAVIEDLEVEMVDSPDPVAQGQPVHFDIDYPVLDPTEGLPPAPPEIGTYGTVRIKFVELTATIPTGLSNVTASFETPVPWATISVTGNQLKVRVQSPVAGSYITIEPDLVPPTIEIEQSAGSWIDLDHIPPVDIDAIASGAAGTSIDWKPPTLLTQVKYKKTVTVVFFPVDVVNWNDADLPCVPVDPNQVVTSTLIEAPNPALSVTTVATEDTVEAGEDIHWTVTAANSGNVPLTAASITAAPAGCTAPGPVALARGAELVRTCTRTTTLADVGSLAGSATADTAETAPVTSATDTVTVTGLPSPTVALTASPAEVEPGETVDYHLTITNEASVLGLTGLAVDVEGADCEDPPASLAAGAVAELDCTYAAALGDVGTLAKVATVESAEVAETTSAAAPVEVVAPTGPAVTLTPGATTAAPGAAIPYTVGITNQTAALALTGLDVGGAGLDCEAPPTSVSVGGTQEVACTHVARNWELGPFAAQVTVDSDQTTAVTADATAVTVAIPPHGFGDIAPTAYFDDAVDYAKFFGLVNGFAGNLFKPGDPVNRGQIVNMLWQLMGRPDGSPPHGFGDVPAAAFYREGLDWAKAEGLVRGFAGNRYLPGDPVNRCQLLNMVWNMVGTPTGAAASGYTDVADRLFCRPAVDWARAQGLLAGVAPGARFRPSQAAKRGEVADVLHRLALTESAWSSAPSVPDPVLFDPTN